MNVLSLFDGLSGGRIALDRLNIKVDNYFASEIDKYAIAVAKHNFPKTEHIGSVVDVDVSKLPKIDLLIGGSPCQGFSFSGRRKGSSTKEGIDVVTLEQYLELKSQNFEFDGQSYLFWEYMRVLKEIREYNPDVKFLLENVVMTKKWQTMFNTAIGVEPIKINSALVSAQSRNRLYWTNIQVDGQPTDKNIKLKDILSDEVPSFSLLSEKIQKRLVFTHNEADSSIIGTTRPEFRTIGQRDIVYGVEHKMGCLMASDYKQPKQIYFNNILRKITPLECERLQTVPDNYTNVPYGKKEMSNGQRYKMIGNGWTIDVICHLLKNVHKPIENNNITSDILF